MNLMKLIVVLIGAQFLVSCASKGQVVTGTEGGAEIQLDRQVERQAQVERQVEVAEIVRPEIARLPTVEDTDADGVPDTSDTCDQTDVGALVNASGCEIVTGVIEGLNFAANESKLTVDTRILLMKMSDGFKRYPYVNIAVEGHTDNRGPAAANLELSKQRVLSVVRFMVSSGIDPQRIKPFGFGESRPRLANATAEGREQNRRIEIKVLNRLP